MADLSERQKAILSTIALTEKDLHITELSRIFGVTHMAVSSSLSNLLRDSYVVEISKERGKVKPLRLTDKGIAAAVVYCGCDFEKIVELHDYRKGDLEGLQIQQKVIKDKALRSQRHVELFKVLLNNELFDRNGNQILDPDKDNVATKDLVNDEERKRFILLLGIVDVQLLKKAKVMHEKYAQTIVEQVKKEFNEIVG